MPENFDLILNAFCVVVLLPLAIRGLIVGNKFPENSPMARYFRADTRLEPFGNLILIAVGLSALSKLNTHFGWVNVALPESADIVIGLVCLVFAVVYLAMWVRAILKVRREGSSPS